MTQSVISAIDTVLATLEATPEQLKSNWCVPREAGRFLYLLAKISGAKSFAELGTSIGYSTLWLAKAAAETQGHVHTIDYFDSRQAQAKANIAAAGLSEFVTFYQGQALDILAQWQEAAFNLDYVFIDAAKKEYLAYTQALLPLMPSGALLIADNTQSHRAEMQDFIDAMHAGALPFDIADLDTPNGLIVARKH